MTKLTPMHVHQQAAEQEHVHDVSNTDIKEPPAAAAAKSLKDSMLALISLAQAQASTLMITQPARVLRGDCQTITHPSFSTLYLNILGLAINKEGYLFVSVRTDKNVKVFSGEGPNGTYIKSIGFCGRSDFRGIAIDRHNNLYVADAEVVRVFDKKGNYVRDVGRCHSVARKFAGSSTWSDIAVDDEGRIYVTNSVSEAVSIFDKQGKFVRDLSPLKEDGVDTDNSPAGAPTGVAVDGDGNVYVSYAYKHLVRMFDRHGTFVRNIGEGIVRSPSGLAVCPKGRIYVACLFKNRVDVFNKTGALLESIPASYPSHVVVDGKGQVCIAEGTMIQPDFEPRISIRRADG
jgi:DNA-binding beta-propeller fold protein YncE